MLIIPAIDIRSGRCVRLLKGDFDQQTVYGDDPVAMAKRWEAEGAQLLHIVDLDGAKDGRAANLAVIQRIVQAVGIPIEVGGGIRTAPDAKALLSAGVWRIVVSTMVFEDPAALKELLRAYARRIVVAVETKNGSVVTRGWQKAEADSLLAVAAKLQSLGVHRLLYTDVTRDGTLTEPNYAEIERLLTTVSLPIIASGGVSSLEAVQKLASLGVEAVIIGKALYEGRLTLKEAQDVS
jgi:phosphoribosylformimino-5-aminoimidazole carboxamide ribotide isomerase